MTENNSDSKQDNTTSETITTQDRQELIETAVRFLKNPKVIPTPLESKRLFLQKKGLTETEIKSALEKSGSFTEQTNQVMQHKNENENENQVVSVEKVNEIQKKPSFLARLFRIVKSFILAGCLTFTAYKLLVKKFLLNNKEKLKKSITKNEELTQSIAINEIKSTLLALKETIENMNNSIKELTLQKSMINSNTSISDDSTNSLKTELQTIKNLLLSRTQFPSLPTISPVIPSWQLESKNSTSPKDKTSSDDSIDKKEENNNNSSDENSQ